MASEEMATRKSDLICNHVMKLLKGRVGTSAPLIVGVQGPQGSGKTTLTAAVQRALEQQGKRTAVFSIDDLYLPHKGLEDLKRRFPDNPLLHGRGQPGTHDMELGTELLHQLRANEDKHVVKLPVFDKSLFSGEGDRSQASTNVTLPLDVVIFEGWCLGFYPIEDEALMQRYDNARSMEVKPFFSGHTLESLRQINTSLRRYLSWYQFIDAFVLLRPDSLQNVFAWRLQAEQAMKASGKPGMTDEQVHAFVVRYMPGYELFGDGPTQRDTPWQGKGLLLKLNKNRDLLGFEEF